MRVLWYGILLAMLSCNGQKKVANQADANAKALTAIGLELLVQDDYSGTDEPESRVITDMKTLKGFFSKVNRTRKPGIPVPDVDFSKEMLLLVCSGERNDGLSPEIVISRSTDTELVLATKHLSKGTVNHTGATTTPFSLYKMPLTERAIQFDSAKR